MYIYRFFGTIKTIKGGKVKSTKRDYIYVNACNEAHAWLILTCDTEQGLAVYADERGLDLTYTGEYRPLSPDWRCERCRQFENPSFLNVDTPEPDRI